MIRYIDKKNINNISICILFSLLISIIPWDLLNPKGFFIDRVGYIYAYEYKRYILDSFHANYYYDYITNEWLWRAINSYSRNILNISPEVFFGFITFLTCFTFSFFIINNSNKTKYLIYLINPIFVAFAYSQLRMAFAMSIFITSINLFKKRTFGLSILLLISCIFIHTAMTLIILILLLSIIIAKTNFNLLLKTLLIFSTGFLLNLLVGPLQFIILSRLGDRRAEYGDFSSPIHYIAIYALYLFIALYYIFRKKIKVFDNYILVYGFIIFSFIFFSLFLGGYSGRLIAATHFFIVLSLFILKGNISFLFHFLYTIYIILLWFGFFI